MAEELKGIPSSVTHPLSSESSTSSTATPQALPAGLTLDPPVSLAGLSATTLIEKPAARLAKEAGRILSALHEQDFLLARSGASAEQHAELRAAWEEAAAWVTKAYEQLRKVQGEPLNEDSAEALSQKVATSIRESGAKEQEAHALESVRVEVLL